MSTNTQAVSQLVQSNPATQTSTSDSWEARIQAAATFMGLSVQTVEKGLKELGVEKEPSGLEMLSDDSITPFGDIRSIFCDNGLFGKIPLAKVRMAMKYLRGPKDSNKTDSIDPEILNLKQKYGFKLKMEDIEPSELLEHYHPDKPNHPVTIALKKRFGDKPVIVFKSDSKVVDIDATANYMADLEQGFPEQETVEVDGTLVRVYSIGQIPNEMVDEDPLFEGKPLKRDRSIVNRVNWAGIEYAVRAFCRIIVDRGDVDVNDRFQVKELIQMASKGIPELKKMYPEADLECRELQKKGELPKLVMPMEEMNGRKQNPFGINKNRNF